MRLGCTVAELQQRMSSAEFAEWVAFAQVEPFGFEADFLGHAQTAAIVANTNRSKDTPAYKIEQFMPKRAEPQTTDQMRQFAAIFTAAWSADNGDYP